ncbi:efflux RND transporter permease subunit [Desulfobaculum bizertense]|uniref:SSD domain-containing protein n=1 Tax=Desulfobaculum bizertense DSM 18034 TaxID=1121442 RepID=A0A1T4VRZ1_9BACT|nr:efflux RND transporter permease subunit [Desulfobaculum bizertense]SKA67752.1 hypothetical protein SAMN02745702_00882 [Desulfobaculum bizertense DSM 18034]
MTQEKNIAFFQKLTAQILRWRWGVLFGVIAVTAFFMAQYSQLKFNGSFEIWFLKDDPAMQRLETFKQTFGNDQFIYILAETDDVFQPETARSLKKLANELEHNVPYLRDLTWIGNAEHISAQGKTVLIEELFKDIPTDPQEMQRRRDKALSEKDFVDRYISRDGKAAGIMLELENFPTEHMVPPPSTQVATAVLKTLAQPEYAGLHLRAVGDPIFETKYNEVAGKETPKFFGLCLLVQAVLLLVFARGGRGIVVPLVIVVLSFLWTLGTIALLGFDLDLMIIGLPVLLICVGIGDSMHAIAEFNGKLHSGLPRRQALLESMGEVGLPCFLTSLTTAIGFFSFSSAPIKPFLQMGLYLPAGVIYAFVLTLLLVPLFYSFGKPHPFLAKRNSPVQERVRNAIDHIGTLATRYPGKTCATFSALMLLGVVGSFYVQVESNPTKFLTKKVELRQDVDFVDARMGGSTGLEIIIDTKQPDGIKQLAVLEGMDRLALEMENNPLVHKSFSLVDVLKKMRRALHNGDKAFYSIPERQQAVPEYMALYEMAGGDQMDKILSFDGSKARINLQTQALGSAETRQLIAQVQKLAQRFFPDNVEVSTTGFVDIAKSLNDNMKSAQASSISLAFCLIALVMMVTLKSVRLGLLSMIPNIMPVFMVLGFLGITGIYMDTILMSVSAMIIGVAVDDTIHFFVHFKREFQRCSNYVDAVTKSLHIVGRPIIFTTLTLSLGFLVLSCSVMTGWIKIGLLSGFAFVWALLADILFAPALLVLLKPLGKEHTTECAPIKASPEQPEAH